MNKWLNTSCLSMVIGVLLLPVGAGSCAVHPSASEKAGARADKAAGKSQRATLLNKLMATIEGSADDNGGATKDQDGYIRSAGAGRFSHFVLPGCQDCSPAEQADAFLKRWQRLVADVDKNIRFRRRDDVENRSSEGGYIYKYVQQYRGMDIYNAGLSVRTTPRGFVKSLLAQSLVRNYKIFDGGRFGRSKKLNAQKAKQIAMDWFVVHHPGADPTATEPALKVYVPMLVRKEGDPCLAWILAVRDKTAFPPNAQRVLLNDHTGEVFDHWPVGPRF